MKKESCNVTVAFFSVTANGTISVRKSNDYVAQMIALSGGTYVPEQLAGEEENALSTMNIQMEDFYADAKNADILIYNSTIEGEISTLEELKQKNALFADFRQYRMEMSIVPQIISSRNPRQSEILWKI